MYMGQSTATCHVWLCGSCVRVSIHHPMHAYIAMSILAKHGERYGYYVPRNMQCMPARSCRYAVVRTN
jgi:hypothetical protein